MSDKPQSEGAADTQSDAVSQTFLEHVDGVVGNVLNARWEEVDFHVAGMDEIVKTADPATLPYFAALYIPVKEFALGFHLFATGQTADEKKSALDHLTQAKAALRKTKTELPDFAKNPGFGQMTLGIELNIINVQEQIAREAGDMNESARLTQQRDQLLDEIQAALPPDDPMRSINAGMKLFQKALPAFSQGMQCLVEMNLDLAQDYLEESSKTFDEMRDLFDKVKTDTLIMQAGKNAAEGFGLLVTGQEIYVRVMRTAIIGDVTRSDAEALKKAERSFVDGAALISSASQIMPGAFGKINLEAAAQLQSRLTRNLRTLCERSLSPKAITITTAPKVVFYFVGTFLVLLIGLPLSGLVAKLQTTDLGMLLIVSLFVSVIAAFGFEATRLVPLFDSLSRLMPWGKSAKA